MSDSETLVFFYGLFMDEMLLASKGVGATRIGVGHADDFELRIGERATLISCPGTRAWGVLMRVPNEHLAILYSDASVADYLAETVVVTSPGGAAVSARCYILPAGKLRGTNPQYAAALLKLATALGFPDSYRGHIRGFT